MSSGAQQGLAYALETTAGVVPVPFARQQLRFTGVTIDGTVTGTESEEIRPDWISSGEYKTSAAYGGEITGELSYGTYDELLSAAFHKDWVANVLSIGAIRKTFSILREYKDSGGFHVFKGMSVTGLNIEIPEEGIVKVTFTLQGMGRDPVTFVVPAGIVTAENKNAVFTNVGVGDITIDGQSMQDIACVTSINLSIEFTAEVQKCLGKGLSAGKIIETGVNISGSMTLAWGDEAASMNELKFTDTAVSVSVPIADGKGNSYTLYIPEATITGELPTGSRQDLLQYQLEYKVRNQSPTLTRVPAIP